MRASTLLSCRISVYRKQKNSKANNQTAARIQRAGLSIATQTQANAATISESLGEMNENRSVYPGGMMENGKSTTAEAFSTYKWKGSDAADESATGFRSRCT